MNVEAQMAGVNSDVGVEVTTSAVRRRGRPRKLVAMTTASPPVMPSVQVVEDMLNVGENGPFICSICEPEKSFKNSTGLRNHTSWKHSVKSKPAPREAVDGYRCDICAMPIRGYAALTMHKWKKHGVEQLHKCERCEMTFSKLRDLHKHMAERHGVQMFKCELCQAEFKSREGWRMHKTKMHVKGEASEVCYMCGKAFKMPYQLKNHIKLTHKTIRDYACHLCTRAFKGCQSLKRHLLTYHSDDRHFACDICESKFKTRADMLSHRKLHLRPINPLPTTGRIGPKKTTENESYNCKYCFKAFAKMLRCKAHEKLVHEYKEAGVRFACTPCDKAFPNQYYLLHHINNKHRQRSHRCVHCERLFTQAYLLRRHLVKCTGNVLKKAHTCRNCGLRFATKTNLAKHVSVPNRCRRNDVVDCVVLVDDGAGSLLFEGHRQTEGGESYLENQEQEEVVSKETGNDLLLDAGDYENHQELGGDYHMEVFEVTEDMIGTIIEEQVGTVEESSVPIPVEEMCVVLADGSVMAASEQFPQQFANDGHSIEPLIFHVEQSIEES